MTFLEQLIENGLLIPSGERGVFGFNAVFERIIDALNLLISREGEAQDAEVMRFPPVIAVSRFEASGYFRNFPNLVGGITCFCGSDADHRAMQSPLAGHKEWSRTQEPSGLAMLPAACYPVYPVIAERGPVPDEGALVDVLGQCFRHEPSDEPTRMQLFRMREFVRIGTAAQCMAFRDEWMGKARLICKSLGLPGHTAVANDPFFGRIGKVLAAGQRHYKLKFEMLIPVNEPGKETACMSFNYHVDKFGQTWGLRLADGETAHSACVAFGLERLALALLRHHGFLPEKFPDLVKKALFEN